MQKRGEGAIMGGNNGRGSAAVEAQIQIELTAQQRCLLIMEIMKDSGERLQRILRNITGPFRAEIDQIFYNGVVRRGIAELFK
jgi:hypothetical protein